MKDKTTNNITTADFSKFGYREREHAKVLLNAWNEQGLPFYFQNKQVTVMMNTRSGNIFLTNADCQVAMMNGDKLESFYHDAETGEEGFEEELSTRALLSLGLIRPEKVIATAASIISSFEFDHYDRKNIELLLLAWNEDNLPESFSRENIRIAKDKCGSLFLTNGKKQVAKLDGYDVRLCSVNPKTGEIEFIEE